MKAKRLFSFILAFVLVFAMLPSAHAEGYDFENKDWDTLIEEYLTKNNIKKDNVQFGYYNTVTGEEHYYNADTFNVSGSMYKVPLCMLVAEKVANGEITWDDEYNESKFSLLLNGAIVASNNDFARDLWNYLGGYQVFRKLAAPLLGEDPDNVDEQYYSERTSCTAREMVTCLRELYENPDKYPTVIDLMKKAEPSKYFARDLKGYELAHKYGYFVPDDDNSHLYLNDCGIVYTEDPFIICCMTDGIKTPYGTLAEYCTMMCQYTEYQTEQRRIREAEELKAAVAEECSKIELSELTPAVSSAAEIPAPDTAPEPVAFSVYSWFVLLLGLLCVAGLIVMKKKFLILVLQILMIASSLINITPPNRAKVSPVVDETACAALVSDLETAVNSGSAKQIRKQGIGYDIRDSESCKLLSDSLLDSYSLSTDGEPSVKGDTYTQGLKMRYLSLTKVQSAVIPLAESKINERIIAEGKKELVDESGKIKTEVISEAVESALTEVLKEADQYLENSTFSISCVARADGMYLVPNDDLLYHLKGID